MAQVTSGSFNTAAYSNRYLTFSWSIKTQSTANNYTVITWSLKGAGSASGYYMSGNFKVVIAGETVYSSADRIELRSGTTVASGEKVIYHETNGSKSFSASAEAGIYNVAVNCKGSESWELKSIPRGATITSMPNFTDEESPTMTINNPAGAVVSAAIYKTDGTTALFPYKQFTGNSFQFAFTNAERQTLQNATTNSNVLTVRVYLRSVIGTQTFWTYVTKTLTIVNASPSLNPTVVDTGTGSLALTGNNPGTMIKYYNHMKATANATTKKGATDKSIKVTNGNTVATSAVSEFIYSENNVFNFEITDSRGNTAKKTVTVTPFLQYVKLTCSLEASAELVAASNTTAIKYTIKGNYWTGNFGAVANTLTVQYRYKTAGGSFGAWQTANTPTISGTTYNSTGSITGLNYQEAYTIEARAIDKITNGGSYSGAQSVQAVPVFDWGKGCFEHHTHLYFDNELAVFGIDTDGNYHNAFSACTKDNVTSLGYGGYSKDIGATQVWGKNVNIITKENVNINGLAIKDFVTEQGSSGIWHYRKWKSGIAECWGIVTVETAITTAWGSMYVGDSKMSRQSYPIVFSSKPTEQATLQSGSSAVWLFAESSGNGVNGGYASAIYNVCRPSAVSTSQTFYISLYAIGIAE